jgi:hypothetical protein
MQSRALVRVVDAKAAADVEVAQLEPLRVDLVDEPAHDRGGVAVVRLVAQCG